MKVDFFIVGAMRSGTSSIRDQLDIDPKINMAHGEPMFFSNDKKYKAGFEEYHKLFNWEDESLILRGEKSPRYAVSPNAAERIYSYNPNAKIIWMLRNPVKRAISHYVHSVYRAGNEAINLSEAILNHESLEKSNSTMAYVYRSQYDKQLKVWSKYFPHQKVVIMEELIDNCQKVMSDLYDYLEIEPSIELDFLRHSRSNVDKKKKVIEENNPVSNRDKENLFNLLEPTITEVENIIGRKLDSWRIF